LNKKELKELLDNLYLKYKSKHSSKDPVWRLHDFSDTGDIEILGLITSCYAYGQVDQINLFVNKFLKTIDSRVHEFTSNYSEHKDKKFLKGLYYRFNTEEDLSQLLINIRNVINNYGSLQNLFKSEYKDSDENILNALAFFSTKLNELNNEGSNYKYLVPLVKNGSTCKRLNLFLRWMVRKDEIDPGIWNSINKSKLIMPVDTHIYRISRKLKLVRRKSCDMRYALELTKKLKQFDPEDPVKYDFAICHLGIESLSD
jgi:uncharacterized protein (TIGR02757 family)